MRWVITKKQKNPPSFEFNAPKVEGNTSNKRQYHSEYILSMSSAITKNIQNPHQYARRMNTLSTDSASSNPFRSEFMKFISHVSDEEVLQ